MSATTTGTLAVAAVDLGATSGRVMVGHVGDGELRLYQATRFPNGPVALPDGLHWDSQALFRAALAGLRDAQAWEPGIASVGIDSWAVDYALLRSGRLLGEPFHYRDARCDAGVEAVHARVGFPALYARNGLQFLPFNTAYQLAAEDPAVLDVADRMLLVPDLLAFWMTGAEVAERTNASTTGLLDVATREWDLSLVEALGLRPSLLPGLVSPGDRIGHLLPSV
ncbi:MAG: FGGY family carbohydrate kinase, partial [Demequina sp.]|uniref:FGGY family carbohydrate kinase n=1 Tax=Demequina sp. TaxID=2050685 RepID=UPI003A8AD325